MIQNRVQKKNSLQSDGGESMFKEAVCGKEYLRRDRNGARIEALGERTEIGGRIVRVSRLISTTIVGGRP